MIFTELAPFTPDSASSTLSWIYWEKLNPIPGNSSSNSFCSCSVSFSLVRFGGHSSKGFSGANSSTLENGEASLPLSGRPCWDTTVMTSGCRKRISRIFPAAAVPEMPPLQRGQELTAEPGGRQPAHGEEGDADHDGDGEIGKRPAKHRGVTPAQRAHDDRFGFLDVCSNQERRQNRRDREGGKQRSGQRIAVGSSHRTADLPLHPLHCKQRHERRDRDRRSEKNSPVDLQRARENN